MLSEGTIEASNPSIKVGRGSSLHPSVKILVTGDAILEIRDNVTIGRDVEIRVARGVTIGDGVVIEEGTRILDNTGDDRGARVIIEERVRLERNATVYPGVRIGQNSVVRADCSVTATVLHNTVVEGSPAEVVEVFDAPLRSAMTKPTLKLAFYGHSLMHHREAYVPELLVQRDLPPVGSHVRVHSWVKRGYVYKLTNALKVLMPHINLKIFNEALGGSNEYQILEIMKSHLPEAGPMDIIFIGCGLTGIWRRYTGRLDEALTIDEFEAAYRAIVAYARQNARRVICVGEAFFTYSAIFEEEGLTPTDVESMNVEGQEYMKRAQKVALDLNCSYVDMYSVVHKTKSALDGWVVDPEDEVALWQDGDGAHYNDLGDTLLSQHLLSYLQREGVVSALLTADRV